MSDYKGVLNELFELLPQAAKLYAAEEFTDLYEIYGEIARVYADHLGLDNNAASKLQFLLQSVCLYR